MGEKHTLNLRRFSGATPEPEHSEGLSPDHPAVTDGRTLFPKSVVSVEDSERLLVSGRNNPKLGAVVQKGAKKGMPIYHLTLEERATCPRSCKVWNECYGNTMPFARRHRIDDLPDFIAKLNSEMYGLGDKHPGGFLVRLHTLGDFFSEEYVALWAALLDIHPALNCFGYTAHAPDSDIGRAIKSITEQRWDRFAIRFSGSSIEQAAWVCDAPVDLPEVVMCPAQTGQTECCATCALCWSENAQDLTIGFLRHGIKRWRPNTMNHEDTIYRKVSDIPIGRLLGEPGEIGTEIPDIRMLPLGKLCIDTRYQRVITGKGRSNIRHIVENFDWMHFQPILVSPVENPLDGETYYAIVDGQHRALAALNHPDVHQVPAAIVEITPEQQAHVFAEINSNIVKVNALEIFWARFASGDEEARRIMDCVEDADLKMLRVDPKGSASAVENEKWLKTFWSPTLVQKCIPTFGMGYTSMALQFLSEWDPESPQAPNCNFMVEAVAQYLRGRELSAYGEEVERLAQSCSYSDAKAKVQESSIHSARRPREIFYHDILIPALSEGRDVEAA